jgi:hypothetical protein
MTTFDLVTEDATFGLELPQVTFTLSVSGIPGPQGPAGADGQDGAQGPAGPTGPQGPPGDGADISFPIPQSDVTDLETDLATIDAALTTLGGEIDTLTAGQITLPIAESDVTSLVADLAAINNAIDNINAIGTGGGVYSHLIGDGSSTSITVTHNLGTQSVALVVRDATTGEQVLVNNSYGTDQDNQLVLSFEIAPTSNQYLVMVIASGANIEQGLDATPRLLGTFSIVGAATVVDGLLGIRVPFDHTITDFYIDCPSAEAPTGSDLSGSLVRNGTAITGISNITLLADSTNTNHLMPSDDGSSGDFYTINITTIGSTTPGSDVSLSIWGIPR